MMKSIRLLVVGALAASAASCGDVVRDSRSPVVLSVSLVSPAGAPPPLTFISHVATPASPDFMNATFTASMRDITVTPTANNQVTMNRYHVEFTRADGHNQAGVDVPFPFDGTFALVVPPGQTASGTFELVRTNAKLEAPLTQLVGASTGTSTPALDTIANITFYGADLVGNQLSVVSSVLIEFTK